MYKIHMYNIINDEVQSFLIKRNNSLRLCEQYRNARLFIDNKNSLNENDNSDKRNDVLSLIKTNQWEQPNPESFYNSLKQSKHPLMLSDYSPQELSKMKLFKLKNYNIGFALKQFDNKGYSEIVAVHNNEPDIKNIGNELMQAAINNGGCYLDHYDGFLSNLYQNMGFIEYNRDEYNPEYDKENSFQNKYGKKDVIYRVHKNCVK
jgi:hypothetical protein